MTTFTVTTTDDIVDGNYTQRSRAKNDRVWDRSRPR
jgi:hypothetical protein